MKKMQNCKLSNFCPSQFCGYVDVAKYFSRTMGRRTLNTLDFRVTVEFPNFQVTKANDMLMQHIV